MKANFYIIGSEPVIFHTKKNYEPGASFKVGKPNLFAVRFKHKILEYCLIQKGHYFTINEARKIAKNEHLTILTDEGNLQEDYRKKTIKHPVEFKKENILSETKKQEKDDQKMRYVKIPLFQATVTTDILADYREELIQRQNFRKAEVIKINLDLLQEAINKMQQKKVLPEMEAPELFPSPATKGN